MMRFLKTSLTLMILVSVIMLTEMAGKAEDAKAEDDVDLSSTLPQQMEMREFTGYKLISSHDAIRKSKSYCVEATRKADKAEFSIYATIAATPADAKSMMSFSMLTNRSHGPIPTGAPSGRKIGEECFNSVRPQGLPGGGLKITARNGRAVVFVRLLVPIADRTGRGPHYAPVNPKDVALVERHAMNVLTRLTTIERGLKPK